MLGCVLRPLAAVVARCPRRGALPRLEVVGSRVGLDGTVMGPVLDGFCIFGQFFGQPVVSGLVFFSVRKVSIKRRQNGISMVLFLGPGFVTAVSSILHTNIMCGSLMTRLTTCHGLPPTRQPAKGH